MAALLPHPFSTDEGEEWGADLSFNPYCLLAVEPLQGRLVVAAAAFGTLAVFGPHGPTSAAGVHGGGLPRGAAPAAAAAAATFTLGSLAGGDRGEGGESLILSIACLGKLFLQAVRLGIAMWVLRSEGRVLLVHSIARCPSRLHAGQHRHQGTGSAFWAAQSSRSWC